MKPEENIPSFEKELNKLEEEYAQGLKDGTMFDALREVRRKIKSLKALRAKLKEDELRKH